MSLDIRTRKDVKILTIPDRRILTDGQITRLGDALWAHVEPKCLLLVDFGRVEYMSSGMFGKLITLTKRVKDADGRLALCSIAPEIYEVFEITRLHLFFKIFKQEEDAKIFLRG